jgi:hypothetical protein
VGIAVSSWPIIVHAVQVYRRTGRAFGVFGFLIQQIWTAISQVDSYFKHKIRYQSPRSRGERNTVNLMDSEPDSKGYQSMLLITAHYGSCQRVLSGAPGGVRQDAARTRARPRLAGCSRWK